MGKQSIIEIIEGIIGICVWVLYICLYPQMPEGWVYLPISLSGIVAIIMIFKRKDYRIPDGFEKYYRKANLETALLTLFVAVVAFLSQTPFSKEVMDWGLWLVLVMYFFLFCHGVTLCYYVNKKLKK